MRPSVTPRPGDMERAQRKLTPQLYLSFLEELIRNASTFALREAQSAAQGLGGIPSSLLAEVRGLDAKVTSAHRGALVREFGRRAGAKLPPPGALERYGRDTFPIAQAIARRGIRGRFFLRKAREALRRSEFPRLIEIAKRRIQQRWGGA